MPSSPDRPDIYNYPRRLELALQNLKQNSKVSERNRQRILAFYEISTAQGFLVHKIRELKLFEQIGKVSTHNVDTCQQTQSE